MSPHITRYYVSTSRIEMSSADLLFGTVTQAMAWLDEHTHVDLNGKPMVIVNADIDAYLARPIGDPDRTKLVAADAVRVTVRGFL